MIVLKRVFDLIVALATLVLMMPILSVAILWIKVVSPGPAFFVQTRVGQAETPFAIFKLRTMTIDPDRRLEQTRSGDPAIIPGGDLLRRLKIDELPQIINVLRGDMSVVGPRPCLPPTLATMPEWARTRFRVRPGLTGLAQVNGNIALDWEQRWHYDVRYVERWSLLLDLMIVAKTFLVLIAGEDRYRRVG